MNSVLEPCGDFAMMLLALATMLVAFWYGSTQHKPWLRLQALPLFYLVVHFGAAIFTDNDPITHAGIRWALALWMITYILHVARDQMDRIVERILVWQQQQAETPHEPERPA